jgi:hypothetical protein
MGWSLIPTYVGLQAPVQGCECASITPGRANLQGVVAAYNAVDEATDLGIGPGNPIYDDMEAYTVGPRNTPSVRYFLHGWTAGLHNRGYVSGVYSSVSSGIADLAAVHGTSYLEPDDIWFADWNGEETTSDSHVPPGDWAGRGRIHQYRGPHTDDYGGVDIPIDSDYCNAAVVAAASLGPRRS